MSEQPTSSMLVLDNLTKIFEQAHNHAPAVDAVSLEIHSGEFVTLLGPSGCGKTTTLRLIAGFEFPSQGRILLDGKDIGNVPPNQRPMAMVFQNYALFPHLDVFENIAYGLRLRKLSANEIRESVSMVTHMMNLTGLEKRSPNQLSGGQQQRVALARAMVMKPKLLLFDEPLSNLDAKLRAQMRSEIHHLQRRLGITSIYVTHDQVEAMSLSDRIVVMNQGHIEQVGRPVEIYLRPASVFVADFIGRANFVKVPVIARQDGLAALNVSGKTVNLPCDAEVQANQLAYAVVRPEAFKFKNEAGAAHFVGTVKSVAYLGSSIEYEVDAADQTLLVVDNELCLEPLRTGTQVNLAIDPLRSYVLPIKS